MKKLFSLFFMLLIAAYVYSQRHITYTYVHHDTPVQSSVQQKEPKQKQIGIITRFGYSFADYFDYGASLFYKFNPNFGIIAGVDGASKVAFDKKDGFKESYNKIVGSISQWDVRIGMILGKYVGFGFIYGNCNVCTKAIETTYPNLTAKHVYNGIHDFGGFATILLPINDYVGFDIDIAYSTHTYFNVSGGIILSLPIK